MEEEYINTKVRAILEELLDSLLDSTPNEPLTFMFTWLHKKYNNTIFKEREELEKLREEFKNYRNNESKNINKKNNDNNSKLLLSEGESEEEEEEKNEQKEKDFQKEIEEKRQKLHLKGGRSGISAEVYGKFNKKEDFKPRVIEKSEQQKEDIRRICMTSILFNSLDKRDLETIIDACEKKQYKEGEYVIKEGENGDELFIIESGELNCVKGNPPIYLKTYYTGESFGELALLYNNPRAATIIAKTNCVLWALDRATFTNIVRDSAVKNREKIKNCLENVEILKTVKSDELYAITEAVKKEKVKKGTYIINQGESGNKFYILDEGEAVAIKISNPGDIPKEVKRYSSGGYFGELALLKNEPRAASVKALTDCFLLSLDRPSFKRLLGPLEEILKRNSEAYAKYNLK